MSNIIRFIGDVHGKLDEYAALAGAADWSICPGGEMGFSDYALDEVYDALDPNCVDPNRHIVVPGNHDNYDTFDRFLNILMYPGYGVLNHGPLKNGFYVRGAFSIDKQWRTEGVDWFPEEELSYSELSNCAIPMYEECKPDIMMTHTCPGSLVKGMLPRHYYPFGSRTESALQSMFEIHQPKLWIFGHMHTNKVFFKGDTTFIALAELATCDINVDKCSIIDYSWNKEY